MKPCALTLGIPRAPLPQSLNGKRRDVPLSWAKAPSANLPAMLVAQLLPFVKNLSTRKWTDEDIIEDVQYLRDELNARFESLT